MADSRLEINVETKSKYRSNSLTSKTLYSCSILFLIVLSLISEFELQTPIASINSSLFLKLKFFFLITLLSDNVNRNVSIWQSTALFKLEIQLILDSIVLRRI